MNGKIAKYKNVVAHDPYMDEANGYLICTIKYRAN